MTDVGPVRPEGLPRHRCDDREVEDVAKDLQRVLHATHRNLTGLTHHVPMAAVEYLPNVIQRHVVGVPYDWVRLFGHVAITIVFFRDAYRG